MPVYLYENLQRMQKEFPLHYTLDDDTEVTVSKTSHHVYYFMLRAANGNQQGFSYNDSEEWTNAKEAALSFDQLNALRRFWLETREES